MKNGPFEDVFPIGDGIFHRYVSLPEGNALFLGVPCDGCIMYHGGILTAMNLMMDRIGDLS